MDIGSRLQSVRNKKNLSQRELAKRVGVTNSTISLIEQNKVSPSISSLKKVLDGIPISLADFFTLDAANLQSDSPFYRKEDLIDVGNGEIHYFLIGQNKPQRQMCILREVMPPGTDTGKTMLQHEGEEGGVIIQGEIELTVGDQSRLLGPGDAYYFESKTPHRFRNLSKQEAILVSANTPATF
ncbi:MAG: cupin domain-containing protein [Shewanella sp.]